MNEQAEYILIGSVLKDNSILDELTLSPEHFLDLQNRQIYNAMLEIKKKGFPIDGASLKDQIGETGFFFIGGNERLQELKDSVPSIHAFKSYERMVVNQWKISTTRELLKETLNNDLTVEALESLIKELSKVDEEGTRETMDTKEDLVELYQDFMTEPEKVSNGIPSGFKDIDSKTDGFRGGNLVIVGARPSIGKTAFLLNMAMNASEKAQAIPVVFSLEMKKMELLKRMVSCKAEINGLKMKSPYHYTNDAEKTKGSDAIGKIGKMKFQVSDRPRQRIAEMRAKVRQVKNQYPERQIIVFIDYLTLIKPSQEYKGNTHAQITEISAELKAMAKDFDCPVVCLAQLSRGVESRQDKRPLMSDLRESGSIEQDADIVMLLYRDEYYNETTEDNRNVLEVDVAKNRDGEVGRVYLRYQKDISKIENLYHYHSQRKAQ